MDDYKALTEIFEALRSTGHDPDDLLKLVAKAAGHLVDTPSLVLGSFVWHRSEKAEIVRLNGSDLLFGPLGQSAGFSGQALATLDKLQEGKLFVSSLIHEYAPDDARKVQLWHSRGCSEATVRVLSTLPDYVASLIPKDLESKREQARETAASYISVVAGYFPDQERHYVLAYCPFLVSDGNPPGNFFAVFACPVCVKCAPYDDTLTWTQMAGTLIFSHFAVRELLNFENHKKFKAIREHVNTLQRQRRDMLASLEALEKETNWYRFGLGGTELEEWKTKVAQSGHFRSDAGTCDDTHSNCKIPHSAKNGKKCHAVALAEASGGLEALRLPLGTAFFEAALAPISNLDSSEGVWPCLYFGKALYSNMIPLSTLGEAALWRYAIRPHRTFPGFQLTFVAAIRALQGNESVTLDTERGEEIFKVCATIRLKEGARDFTLLKNKLSTKESGIENNNFAGDLTREHTSSCLAVLYAIAAEKKEEVENSTLRFVYSFNVGSVQ